MHGAWRLITPGRTYRPPVTGDEPRAAESRALAERDLATGRTVKDWTDGERERWLHGRRKYEFFARHYRPIRYPEPPLAPPRWWDELLLLAIMTALTARIRQGEDTPRWAFAWTLVWVRSTSSRNTRGGGRRSGSGSRGRPCRSSPSRPARCSTSRPRWARGCGARITIFGSVTLDGVMQGLGRADADTRGGFAHGGWGDGHLAQCARR